MSTVITYGGGEILSNIFNSIAILMNNQHGSFIRPLLILTASLGGLWAISKALFSQSAHAFLSGYIFPLIVIPSLLMVPTASVHIEDILKDRSYKVDHVPFLLAKFSEITSSVGYYITNAFESVMHVPNDLSYNQTGMIFGADNALDISRYKISNANLEQNLRRFCKQCVLYDISLGKYTVDDLKKSTDLWKFFEENTSKVRMIQFTALENRGGEGQYSYLSCKEAMAKMTPYFEQEKRYYGQFDVLKNLPLTFQAITGIQKEKEELIGQQLMMNVLSGEYGGNHLAKSRAQAQQKNTYQVLGALASNSLVTLRAVLEALVYAAFILIFPLALLPNGIKFIMTWMSLVVWIQLWPPFYAVLNYIMQTVSHSYAESIFNGLASTHHGLSFFTSAGLQNLHEDIFALSGYLAASIPFITYAILKGGVSSFVHLAGSMMSPAHQAASSAASEQASGNYSFANTSFGQTSYRNTSALQTQLAPSFSAGYYSENTGLYSATFGPDEQILKQGNSDLRTSFFSDDSISQSMQHAKQHALSNVETSQKNFLESTATHSRNAVDLTEHLANGENYSSGISEREATDIQESARYLQSVSENWGHQYGLGSRASMNALVGASIGTSFGFGLPFLKNIVSASFHGDGKYELAASRDETFNSALNISKSEDFQKHLQRIQDFASHQAYSSLNDRGMRLSDSFTQSLESMNSAQTSFQTAQSEMNQVSENASWATQNSQLVKTSLNQEFVNWASQRYAESGGIRHVEDILSRGPENERASLIGEYVQNIRSQTPTLNPPEAYEDPATAYAHANVGTIDYQKELQNLRAKVEDGKLHLHSDEMDGKIANLFEQTQRGEGYASQIQSTAENVRTQREAMSKNVEAESDKFLFTRVFRLAPFSKTDLNNFQLNEAPFWMQNKDD